MGGIITMAEKLDYEQIANDIVMAVGGPDNIKIVAHCMTRIRFMLKKDSDANTTTVKSIPGVIGVVSGGASGEYMVILGQHLLPVFEAEQTLTRTLTTSRSPLQFRVQFPI